MLFVRLLPLILVLFLVEIAAYKPNASYRTSKLNIHGNRRPYIHESHLRNEPLILTEDPETDELVVSESPTHGLNRLISDRNRRNAANGPKYKVGTTVYVRNGPLRSSKGTVLYNKPGSIGDSYKVQVALDCRDKRGYLNGQRSLYHGISTWFFEDELTDHIPYTSRERLNNQPQSSGYDSRLAGMYHRELIDSYDAKDITDIYNAILSKGLSQKYTCFTVLTQLAKVYHWKNNYMAFNKLQQRELLEDIYQVVISSRTLYERHLSWMIWALGVFNACYDLEGMTRHLDILREVENKLSFGVLRDYDQASLQGMIWPYARLEGDIGISILKNIANVVTYIPVEDLKEDSVATIAFALFKRKIYVKKLVDHIENLIKTNPHKISPYNASKLLSLFSFKNLERSDVIETLASIVFADEGYHGNQRQINDEIVVNLVRGFSRNRKCLNMLTEYVYSKNPKYKPKTMGDAIRTLHRDGVSCKLGTWLIRAIMDDINEFDSSELSTIIYYASNLWDLPEGFASLIRDYILSPFANPDAVAINVLLASINFFLKTQNHDEGLFFGILSKFDKMLEHERILTISKGYYTVKALYAMGECGYVGLENLDAKYPNIINACLSTLRGSLNVAPAEFIGLYLGFLFNFIPNLVNASSMLAKKWMDDPKTLDVYDTPTTALTEILIAIKIAFENAEFSEDPHLESLSLSERKTNDRVLIVGKEALRQFDETRKISKWPFLFLDILTRANMINGLSREEELLQYSMRVAESISNNDLTRLVNSLKGLGLYDSKWESFVHSLPRGIQRVTE